MISHLFALAALGFVAAPPAGVVPGRDAPTAPAPADETPATGEAPRDGAPADRRLPAPPAAPENAATDPEAAPIGEWSPRPRRRRAPSVPAAPDLAVVRPPPPPHLGRWWVGMSLGSQWRLDRGWDAYRSDASDGSFGLVAGVDLRRPRPRLALGAGAGWRVETPSADVLDTAAASLRVDSYLALGYARFDVFRWLAAEGTLSAGAAHADSRVGDLDGTAWAAIGRAGLGIVLRTFPGLIADFPRVGASANFEGGFTGATSFEIEGKPMNLPKDPLPGSPVALGSVNPWGPFFAFTLRAHF